MVPQRRGVGRFPLRYGREKRPTLPDEIAAWLALAELEPVEGGELVLTWQNTDDEGNTAVARGALTALDPAAAGSSSRTATRHC